MLRSLRALCAVSVFAVAVLGPGALLAAGDDGPSHPTRAERPARTVLRPLEVPELAPLRLPVPSAKEAIVLVSSLCVLPALLIVFLGPPLLSLLG